MYVFKGGNTGTVKPVLIQGVHSKQVLTYCAMIVRY